MNSFFTSTGSSPPEERPEAAAGHDPRPEEQEGAGPLPEELIEALAGLLAEALVRDIRQYPDLQQLSLSHASLPDPAEVPVTAPPGPHTHPQQSQRSRHTPTRRVRRPVHAPSDQRVHATP